MKKKANKKNYDGWMRRFWNTDKECWDGFYSGFSGTKQDYLNIEEVLPRWMRGHLIKEKLVKVKIRIVK